jgi:Xaa-Pro aminopeptidase
MSGINSRLRTPVSRKELERRWALIRAEMKEADVDAVIIQAANNLTGTAGHYRWMTGIAVASSYPQAMIIPRDGLSTVVMHGDFDGVSALDDKDPAFPGVGLRLTAPSFPACHYSGAYDADLVAGEIHKRGYRKLAVVNPNPAFAGFFKVLDEKLGHPAYTDLTARIDEHKANKSEEEIEYIRAAAQMQDSILSDIKAHIKPGMTDNEVFAYGLYLGQLRGSETGYMLGSSAPVGQPTMIRRSGEHGRRIEDGDVMYFQCENTGPGGYFVHAGRYYVLGKAPQQLQDLYGAMNEAQDFTVGLLQVGASCREIFKEYNAYMTARGFPPEGRIHCHGQGYDNVEPPLVRSDETMTLKPNTNMGIHPAVARKDMFVTSCDNFLINRQGAVERLHRAPREIVELT